MAITLKPQTLVTTALKDAEKALKQANKGNAVISQADYERLPSALQGVVDDFKAAGNERVKTNDILGALKRSLESGLKQSLQKGELVAGEMADLGQLVSYSSIGVQVERAIAQKATANADFSTAAQNVEVALDQADLGVTSQLRVLSTLQQAAKLAKIDAADQAPLIGGIAKDRGKLLRTVADQTVKTAQAALKASPNDAGKKLKLAFALQAAVDVHTQVNPKSVRVKALRAEQTKLGIDVPQNKPAQPFFARFLENQNRPGSGETPRGVEDAGMMVTLKYPSDGEDGGAGDGGSVTEKFPSDAEDGGADDVGGGSVTEKFPSDAEDGGADDVGGGNVVTEKYPSDAEDGGDGSVGDFVTLKYPSDGEDGGSDDVGGGGAVTAKFPSDAEDGGSDPGTMVTLKFPSDGEDGGGGGGLIPELRPEVQPELIPELRPEVGVELIPELRPEVVVEVAPDGSDTQTQAATAALAVAWKGSTAVDKRVAKLEKELKNADYRTDDYALKNTELAGLKGLRDGSSAIGERIAEIERLFMVALLDPQGHRNLTFELGVLQTMKSGLQSTYKATADKLGRHRHRSAGEDAAMRALNAGAEGRPALERRMKELDDTLSRRARWLPGGTDSYVAERAVIKALLAGGPTLDKQLADLRKNMTNFGGTYEEQSKLTATLQALQIVGEQHKNLRDFTSVVTHPELIPELRPEVVVELMPELRPEVVVELMPELRPEVVVEVAPEVRPATGDAAVIGKAIRKVAWLGMADVEKRMEAIDFRLTRRDLVDPKQKRNLEIERAGLKAYLNGADVVKGRVDEIERLMLTARFSAEGYEAITMELDVMKELKAGYQTYGSRIAHLSSQQNATHAQNAESMALMAAMGGEPGMEKRMAELLAKMANETHPAKLAQMGAERAGIKALLHGGDQLQHEIKQRERLQIAATMTPEQSAVLQMELDVLRALLGDLKGLVGDAAPGSTHPELIVELMPELRPEVIVEVAPDILNRSDDDE